MKEPTTAPGQDEPTTKDIVPEVPPAASVPVATQPVPVATQPAPVAVPTAPATSGNCDGVAGKLEFLSDLRLFRLQADWTFRNWNKPEGIRPFTTTPDASFGNKYSGGHEACLAARAQLGGHAKQGEPGLPGVEVLVKYNSKTLPLGLAKLTEVDFSDSIVSKFQPQFSGYANAISAGATVKKFGTAKVTGTCIAESMVIYDLDDEFDGSIAGPDNAPPTFCRLIAGRPRETTQCLSARHVFLPRTSSCTFVVEDLRLTTAPEYSISFDVVLDFSTLLFSNVRFNRNGLPKP